MQSIFVSAFLVASSMLSVHAFNASDVDEATRRYWCDSQVSQCPLLCADIDKSTLENSCWPDNLYYICTCAGNVEPNSTEYSQTIPYFTCSLQLQDCIDACGTNPRADCSDQCKKTHKCGASNPTKSNKTATADSATPSKTGASEDGDDGGDDSGEDSGFATSDGGSSGGDSGAGSLALQLGSSYGLGVVAAGVAAALVGL